jgi:DNA-binding IclR family transcriptional regulator
MTRPQYTLRPYVEVQTDMRDTLRTRVLRVLNTTGGLNLSHAAVALGEDLQRVRREVRTLQRDGMVDRNNDLRYRPTILGLDYLQQHTVHLRQLDLLEATNA